MNKIDFGNVLLQSKPVESDRNSLRSTMKNSSNDKFQSIFHDAGKRKDLFNSEDTQLNSDHFNNVANKLNEVSLDENATELNNEEEVSESAISMFSLEQLIEEYRLGTSSIEEDIGLSTSLPLVDVLANDIDLHSEEAIEDQLQSEVLTQLQAILQQLANLMKKGEHEEDFVQVTKSIHKLLQLWGRLPHQLQQSLKENEFMLENVEEESDVLRDLINLFEKRNTFAKQQMYQTNSSITNEDIEKWLQQALSKHSFIDGERVYVNVDTKQNQPLQMSATQQYTLHVTESERVDAISRNLVSDLSNIVSRSNFLKQPGLEELTLTLRPQSLGDVTIRLSQINGEMTVRFLVTTQAARELFESNLHQLKPMFAPNNVVIERDVGISDEEFYQEEQEQFEEEEQKEKDQQSNHDDTSQADLSFDELLQFLSEEANI